MTSDTTKLTQRMVDKVKPVERLSPLEDARQMLNSAEQGANGSGHPNWSDDDVAEVLRQLVDEHETLRAALAEALDEWAKYDADEVPINGVPNPRIAELRKLVKP